MQRALLDEAVDEARRRLCPLIGHDEKWISSALEGRAKSSPSDELHESLITFRLAGGPRPPLVTLDMVGCLRWDSSQTLGHHERKSFEGIADLLKPNLTPAGIMNEDPDSPEPSEPRRPSPLEKLTRAGRMLFGATIVLFGAGVYGTISIFSHDMPPGRYPIIPMLIPAGLVAFFFFLGTAWMLERAGIPIYANPNTNDHK